MAPLRPPREERAFPKKNNQAYFYPQQIAHELFHSIVFPAASYFDEKILITFKHPYCCSSDLVGSAQEQKR